MIAKRRYYSDAFKEQRREARSEGERDETKGKPSHGGNEGKKIQFLARRDELGQKEAQ